MGNKNSGARPRPTALKILQGNPGKRALPVEAKIPVGPVVKPEGMSPCASRVWDAMAPVCIYMGTLTAGDDRAFWKLCELEATWEASCKEKGTEAFSARLERETANAVRPYYEYFGLTASARARMATIPKPTAEPASKWAGALK